MNDSGKHPSQDVGHGVTRRNFLETSRNVAIGTVVGSTFSGLFWLDDAVAAIPASEGYLLVDTKKCQGCVSCMLACSLVHEGVENLSLSRIQVLQNSFAKWPDDLTIEQCRQCVEAPCVAACPEDALQIDAAHGNVRRVDEAKCIGCGLCVEACPFTPSRPIVAPDSDFDGDLKSRKCDLCAGAAYHWDDSGGGPRGKQACVEVCPLGAIRFTAEIPVQEGDSGYKVNLSDANWQKLGYRKK
jgi:protein NrfC